VNHYTIGLEPRTVSGEVDWVEIAVSEVGGTGSTFSVMNKEVGKLDY